MIRRLFLFAFLASFSACTCGRAKETPPPPPTEGTAAPPSTASAQATADPAGSKSLKHVQTGAAVTCMAHENCNWNCPAGSCVQICANKSACNASCEGGGCRQTCAHDAICNFDCQGGKCRQSCSGSSCNKKCGPSGDCI